jgi:hypothetical protein
MGETIPPISERGFKKTFIPELWSPVLYRKFKEESIFSLIFPPPPPLPWYRRKFNLWRYRFGFLYNALRMIARNCKG